METVEPALWPWLAGGLACLAGGWALRTTARLDALLRLFGGGPASAVERGRLPAAILFCGAAWLFVWLSLVLPFTGGQRPWSLRTPASGSPARWRPPHTPTWPCGAGTWPG